MAYYRCHSLLLLSTWPSLAIGHSSAIRKETSNIQHSMRVQDEPKTNENFRELGSSRGHVDASMREGEREKTAKGKHRGMMAFEVTSEADLVLRSSPQVADSSVAATPTDIEQLGSKAFTDDANEASFLDVRSNSHTELLDSETLTNVANDALAKGVKVLTGKECLRVKTGSAVTGFKSANAGYIIVKIDSGSGLKVEVDGKKRFKEDSTVFSKCYPKILRVQVQNTKTDGWWGSIEYSGDGEATFQSMICKSGCVKEAGTQSILVDGDNSADKFLGGALCINKKVCELIKDPTKTPTTTPATKTKKEATTTTEEKTTQSLAGHRTPAAALCALTVVTPLMTFQ